MLANPLYPAAPQFSPKLDSEDIKYRPSKDLEAFNKLLPPAIEFVEGSSSGALAVPEGKYEPINAPATAPATVTLNGIKASKADRPKSPKPASTSPTQPSRPGKRASVSPHPYPIDSVWPQGYVVGKGLHNSGNSCFLNSALQILLHTPPLLRVAVSHKADGCPIKDFCMTCAFRTVALRSHLGKGSFMPQEIGGHLKQIAKHMRKGRQEDSHEFLRYAIDAFQKTCLAGLPAKPDPKIAETSWVHKIFGGRLRSRVTCESCHHNSDTFDSILDLSLDIHNINSLKEAFRKFVAVDYLKGADKYKCEKCKRPVNAQKRFTIHEAPHVLTVHLKRFSPLGRKIGHHVAYDEQVSIQSVMSEDKYGPTYSLYGVVCHAGGGPNSGHYYAYVKSQNNRWYEMNDESVSATAKLPLGLKNAYMLFYMRNKGEGLEATLGSSTLMTPKSVVASMKKRKADSEPARDVEMSYDDEDTGTKLDKPFIGPVLPSSLANGVDSSTPLSPTTNVDPQAAKIKQKIEAASKSNSLPGLVGYGSDSGGSTSNEPPRSSPPPPPSSPPHHARSSPPPQKPSNPISPANFYASTGGSNKKKRKSPDTAGETTPSDAKKYATTKIPLTTRGLDPYGRMHKPNQQTYGKSRSRGRPRGL